MYILIEAVSCILGKLGKIKHMVVEKKMPRMYKVVLNF